MKGNLLSNDYVKFNIYLLVNNNKINLTTSWYRGEFSTNITLNSTGKWTIKAIFAGQGRYYQVMPPEHLMW
ncbi:MAG: hypothetical protein E7Z85_04355 [Methanosphaera stadtmanae]|nr:hypothetical protein [Methanosphaera stadtmanae]